MHHNRSLQNEENDYNGQAGKVIQHDSVGSSTML
jgi:hypothetical protein